MNDVKTKIIMYITYSILFVISSLGTIIAYKVNLGTRRRIIVYTILLLCFVTLMSFYIWQWTKGSDTIEYVVPLIILFVITITFILTKFAGHKVNSYSMIIMVIIIILLLFIPSIYLNSKYNNEFFSNLPLGYKKINGKFVPYYGTTSKSKIKQSKEKNILEEELTKAKNFCKRQKKLEDKLGKYYDNESKSTYFLQGPCKYDGNKIGIKLLSRGNICLPIEKIKKKIKGAEKIKEKKKKKIDYSYLFKNPDQTKCYDKSTDFESLCRRKLGKNYGVKYIKKCPKPFNNLFRANCAYGYFDGSKIKNDEMLTKCYDKSINLNTVCKNFAFKNPDISNYQLYGVHKYSCKGCDHGQRALCKPYHYDGLPTYPENSTRCIDSQNIYKFNTLCKKKGKDMVPINIGVYDCEFGKVRAKCVTKKKEEKLYDRRFFYKNIYD